MAPPRLDDYLYSYMVHQNYREVAALFARKANLDPRQRLLPWSSVQWPRGQILPSTMYLISYKRKRPMDDNQKRRYNKLLFDMLVCDYMLKNNYDEVAPLFAKKANMDFKLVRYVRYTANSGLVDLWDWIHRPSSQADNTLYAFRRRPRKQSTSSSTVCTNQNQGGSKKQEERSTGWSKVLSFIGKLVKPSFFA